MPGGMNRGNAAGYKPPFDLFPELENEPDFKDEWEELDAIDEEEEQSEQKESEMTTRTRGKRKK